MDDEPDTVERHTSPVRGAPAAGLMDDVADALRATLVADSQDGEAAAFVPVRRSTAGPRLLSFECSSLAVDVEVDETGGHLRMFGQVIPVGSALIEVRQEHDLESRFTDADRLGRFVVDDIRAGSTSMTCHRLGERPVTTDWASL